MMIQEEIIAPEWVCWSARELLQQTPTSLDTFSTPAPGPWDSPLPSTAQEGRKRTLMGTRNSSGVPQLRSDDVAPDAVSVLLQIQGIKSAKQGEEVRCPPAGFEPVWLTWHAI